MYSLVVSDLPIETLLDAIQNATGTPFVRVPVGQKTVDHAAGDAFVAGETNGRSYLLELSASMIACMRSRLARISRDYRCLMVAASHDRMESQCEFFAAQNHEILRLFWHNSMKTTRDFSVGEPLTSELEAALSMADGSGISAALHSFGFHQMDYAAGFQRLPGDFVVTWAGDSLKLMEDDEFNRQINDHVLKNPNATYVPLVSRVRVRPIDM